MYSNLHLFFTNINVASADIFLNNLEIGTKCWYQDPSEA